MKGHHLETPKERLVMKTINLAFKHLLKFHRDDAYAVVRNSDFLFPGTARNQSDLTRAIQRHLYHLSRSLGWRRYQRPGKNPITGKRWSIGPWIHDAHNPLEKTDPETGELYLNPAVANQYCIEKYKDDLQLMDNTEFVGQCIMLASKCVTEEFELFIKWLFEDNNPYEPKPRPVKTIVFLRDRFNNGG
jgi:hypothetical protein